MPTYIQNVVVFRLVGLGCGYQMTLISSYAEMMLLYISMNMNIYIYI